MSQQQGKNIHDMSLNNLLSLYVFGGLALVAIVGYFVIRPLFIGAQEIKADVAVVRNDITGLVELGEDTELLRQNYEQVRDERDQIISLLPDENKEEDLLALLDELATRSGVLFSNFRPETARSNDQDVYLTYTTAVNVTGRHGEIIRFMNLVENSSRFMEFSTISARGTGDLNVPNPEIGTSLILKAYYRSPQINTALAEQEDTDGQVE